MSNRTKASQAPLVTEPGINGEIKNVSSRVERRRINKSLPDNPVPFGADT